MSIPAGWYDDGSGTQRWWDGQGWTEHFAQPATSTADGEVASAEVQAPAQQPYAQQSAPQPQIAPQSGSTNGLAIAALILGILGFAIIPVIFGHIALGQIKRNPAQGGRGLAIAGLVLGYIGVAFWLLVIFIAVISFFTFAARGY